MNLMPTLFIGHGSPMNAIENNEYSNKWKAIGKALPKPKAILSVSAHWFTLGTGVCNAEQPKMIYDMYGFPEELYRLVYPAPGAPALAVKTQKLLPQAKLDSNWGFDHGTWSVLHHLFPHADIPVYQLSVNSRATPEEHYRIGTLLKALRQEGVLIFGSGNVVHNLALATPQIEGGYDWAEEFDNYIKECVTTGRYDDVVNFTQAGSAAKKAVPIMDHFAPLLYVLGAAEATDKLTVFNDSCLMGSLSMTSYLFE